MSIVAILQARLTSKRLPGKVLRPLAGQPMILRQIERIRGSKLIDELILATSTDSSDDPLVEVCAGHDVHCFRGSLEDVLDRFTQAARSAGPGVAHLVRLTGDCPLIDPEIIDQTIEHHIEGDYDYTSNSHVPSYPDGLDTEVMKFSALERACRDAHLPSEREHVTPYLYHHPELFKIGLLRCDRDLSHLRWTVDEEQDYHLISAITEALGQGNAHFGMEEIIEYIGAHPELTQLNSHIKRNEGYLKSLEKDRLASRE